MDFPIHDPIPTSAPAPLPRERAAIDASLRRPVLFFLASALGWLLIADGLRIVLSIEALVPGFLADHGGSSYGRIEAASRAAALLGWASMAGYGAALWLMARLGGVPLPRWGGRLLTGIAAAWNAALLAGIAGLLGGRSTGVAGLELPPRAALVLLALQIAIAGIGLLHFWARREGTLYVSQGYLLGALLWFPGAFGLAESIFVIAPIPGPVGGIAAAWFAGAVFGLWLLPVGLAAIYYLIPKVTGRTIESGSTAWIGFGFLALAAGATGAARLTGGTAPAWVTSAGIGADILMLIPVLAAAFDLYPLLRGPIGRLALAASPVLRCAVCALTSFVLLYGEKFATGFRSTGGLVRFTYWEEGRAALGLDGFAAFALFAAIYYIAPRLSGWEWPSVRLVRLHFWGAAAGVVLLVGALAVGGLLQGFGLSDRRVPLAAVLSTALPFLWLRTAALLILFAAHAALAVLFVQLLLRVGPRRAGPTLFPVDTDGTFPPLR